MRVWPYLSIRVGQRKAALGRAFVLLFGLRDSACAVKGNSCTRMSGKGHMWVSDVAVKVI